MQGLVDQVVWCGGHVMLIRWWGAGSSGSSGMVWGSCFPGGVLEGVMFVRWHGVGSSKSSGMVWMSYLSGGVVWSVVDQVVWCGCHTCQVAWCGV